MTLNRIFWTATALIFMGFGILGAYLLGMLVYTSFYPMIYPLQWVNDRNGVLYPVVLIVAGIAAFLLYRIYWRLASSERRAEMDSFHRQYGD